MSEKFFLTPKIFDWKYFLLIFNRLNVQSDEWRVISFVYVFFPWMSDSTLGLVFVAAHPIGCPLEIQSSRLSLLLSYFQIEFNASIDSDLKATRITPYVWFYFDTTKCWAIAVHQQSGGIFVSHCNFAPKIAPFFWSTFQWNDFTYPQW